MKIPKSPALVHLATLITVWVTMRLVIVNLFPSPSASPGTPRPDVARRPDYVAGQSGGGAGPGIRPHRLMRLAQQRPEAPEAHSAAQLQTNRDDSPAAADAIAPAEVPRPPIADLAVGSVAGEFLAAGPRRWSLSGYALVRPGSGSAGIAPNGQLGGSQAGLRVQRKLVRLGRFALSANGRVSAPLAQQAGKEAGLGFALRRSGGVPVELLVEKRVALGTGGSDAFAVLAAGGFDYLRLPGKLLLSGYAQAGIVGIRRRDGFADGAIRAERDVLTIGQTGVRVGAVLTGAKQPRVSRLDVGPEIAARFRLAGASARLSAEWRERIGGNAAPGSGPAITLGFDY